MRPGRVAECTAQSNDKVERMSGAVSPTAIYIYRFQQVIHVQAQKESGGTGAAAAVFTCRQ